MRDNHDGKMSPYVSLLASFIVTRVILYSIGGSVKYKEKVLKNFFLYLNVFLLQEKCARKCNTTFYLRGILSGR